MRINLPKASHYAIFSRIMFWLQNKKNGFIFLPTKVWGLSPKLYATFMLFNSALTRKSSPLDPGLRSLVNTYVSQLNHCAFCVDLNSSFLEKLGISHKKITSLSEHESNPLFSQTEKLALAYAQRITLSTMKVDDNFFKLLKKAFNDKEIVELTALISFQNLSSKFNSALDIESQGFCSIQQPEGYS